MAKLVALTEGLTGKTFELKVERSTFGRVEDNTFQILDQSVSGHHCEIQVRGKEVLVKDLNSTNGTYINGEKVSESALQPGQVLRLGQVELRFENGEGAAPAAAAAKKGREQTRGVTGVKANDFDQGTRQIAFEKSSPFAKKSNKTARVFVGIGVALGIIIVICLIYAFQKMR